MQGERPLMAQFDLPFSDGTDSKDHQWYEVANAHGHLPSTRKAIRLSAGTSGGGTLSPSDASRQRIKT